MEIELGVRFRKARKRAKLTQTVAAARIGIEQGYLSDIERGDAKNPSIPIIWESARTYKCSSDFLLSLTDQPTAQIEMSADEKRIIGEYRLFDEQQRRHFWDYLSMLAKLPKVKIIGGE